MLDTVTKIRKLEPRDQPHQEIDRILRESSHLGRSEIKATIRQDIIFLEGKVSSFYLFQMAQETIRDWAKKAGMKISNQLEVSYTT